jgi:DNA-binding protein HU-beta
VNRTQLIAAAAERAGSTKKDTEAVLNAMLDTIAAEVTAGRKVTLTGFGTFERKTRPERRGFNPRTQQHITVPATNVPKFKAGADFKGAVQERSRAA